MVCYVSVYLLLVQSGLLTLCIQLNLSGFEKMFEKHLGKYP